MIDASSTKVAFFKIIILLSSSCLKYENIGINENQKIIIDHTSEKYDQFRRDLKVKEYVLECLLCKTSNSIKMCKQCSLSYCENCFDRKHSSAFSKHESISNSEIELVKAY